MIRLKSTLTSRIAKSPKFLQCQTVSALLDVHQILSNSVSVPATAENTHTSSQHISSSLPSPAVACTIPLTELHPMHRPRLRTCTHFGPIQKRETRREKMICVVNELGVLARTTCHVCAKPYASTKRRTTSTTSPSGGTSEIAAASDSSSLSKCVATLPRSEEVGTHCVLPQILDPAVYGDTEWIAVLLHGQSFMLHQVSCARSGV